MYIDKKDIVSADELLSLIFQTDENGELLYINSSFQNAIGYTESALLGKPIDKFIYPADLWLIKYNRILAARGKLSDSFQFRIQQKNGEYFWVECFLSCSSSTGKKYLYEGHDITVKQQTTKEEKDYLKSFEILSKAAAGFVDLPPDENLYVHISSIMADLLQDNYITVSSFRERDQKLITETFFAPETMLSKVAELIGGSPIGKEYPLDNERKNILLTRSIAKVEGGVYELALGAIPKPICSAIEMFFNIGDIYVIGLTKNGRLFGSVIMILKKGRRIEFMDVISAFVNLASSALERKAAEELIRNSLKEKELLLKEIHHRVKNNMQVISSLLSLQSGYAVAKEDAALFTSSQNRVKSMALVHDILYKAKDISHIDFGEYTQNLSRMLLGAYNTNKDISLKLDIKEIYLGVDTAVPLGLMLNELITNSLKYAFPDKRKGIIEITLNNNGDNNYTLTVADDGVGIPEKVDAEQSDSLGMTLIYSLAKQVNGIALLEKENGTKFTIQFKPNAA